MHTVYLSPDCAPSDEALEAVMAVSVVLAQADKALFMVGAGISTSAGIPDFRSGEAGLYSTSSSSSASTSSSPASRLSSNDTKHLFSYSSLLNPASRAAHLQLMASLRDQLSLVRNASSAPSRAGKARERPTVFHALMKELDERGKLHRVWSQNVDSLEAVAGLGFVDLDRAAEAVGQADEADSGSDYERSEPRRPPERKRRKVAVGPSHGNDGGWNNLPPQQKVVAMHGTLKEVVCAKCGWKGRWRKQHSKAFRKGETVGCPRCDERATARVANSKRPLPRSSLAFLRPALTLYDDPSASTTSASLCISSLASFDLSQQPDFLLVAGTSLQIRGFKELLKAFAGEVRARGGVVVLVNREPVAKEWRGVFDFDFRADTDAFATLLLNNLAALSPRAPSSASPSSSSRPPMALTASTNHGRPPKPASASFLPTPSPTPSLTASRVLRPSPPAPADTPLSSSAPRPNYFTLPPTPPTPCQLLPPDLPPFLLDFHQQYIKLEPDAEPQFKLEPEYDTPQTAGERMQASELSVAETLWLAEKRARKEAREMKRRRKGETGNERNQ
ncbi:hypothetical protein JCM5296_003366 [Sporobolomyces johnsonii]